MRMLTLIFLLTTLFCCTNRKSDNLKEQISTDLQLSTSLNISAIDAKFPLRLSEINFDKRDNLVQLNDGIKSKIQQIIKGLYTNECLNDSLYSYKDAYINTIRLHDSLHTIYLVLLKHYPTGVVNSKVLFYYNTEKKFGEETFDFNLHAMYDFKNGKLSPTNLKMGFKITTPEIELLDFDKNGVNDYKFTRLFHNGTFNAIHTTILAISKLSIDTLTFNEESLWKFKEK